MLKPTQPVSASGKTVVSSKPSPTGEKYRGIRERKHSATDYAGIIMGRRNLQKVSKTITLTVTYPNSNTTLVVDLILFDSFLSCISSPMYLFMTVVLS